MRDAIEMRPALLHSPRVLQMANHLRRRPDFLRWAMPGEEVDGRFPFLSNDVLVRLVVGTLIGVWATARALAPDGYMEGATLEEVDRIAGVPGFGAAMQTAGWLELQVGGILLPNFEEWNPQGMSSALDDREPEGFAEFWAVYPKKVAKGAALKMWKKIRPGKRLVQVMIQAVELQKRSSDWAREKGRYIPHPATWLSQTRWEDVPEHVAPSPEERRQQAMRVQAAMAPPPDEADKMRRTDALAKMRESIRTRQLRREEIEQRRVQEGRNE